MNAIQNMRLQNWADSIDNHLTKNQVFQARICSIAFPVFEVIEASFSAFYFIKSLGQFIYNWTPLPFVNKGNHLSTLGDVEKHAIRTILFTVHIVIAPLFGFLFPRENLEWHTYIKLITDPKLHFLTKEANNADKLKARSIIKEALKDPDINIVAFLAHCALEQNEGN